MTKDSIVFGAAAGFVGNVAKELIVWPLHYFGLLRYTFAHIAAGYFVPQNLIDNPFSLAIGVITDWTLAGIIGVVLLYIIRRTGHDFAILKGIGFATATYIFMFGALMALDVTRASLATPLPNFLLLLPHVALGVGIGWFIGRYDDVRLSK